MLKEALRKIHTEITSVKGADKDPVTVIGSMLMDHIRSNAEDVKKVLSEDKSVLGSWKHMQGEATKQNKMAFSPMEGFRIVLQYYGVKVPEAVPEPVVVAFDVDLDKLLEGV